MQKCRRRMERERVVMNEEKKDRTNGKDKREANALQAGRKSHVTGTETEQSKAGCSVRCAWHERGRSLLPSFALPPLSLLSSLSVAHLLGTTPSHQDHIHPWKHNGAIPQSLSTPTVTVHRSSSLTHIMTVRTEHPPFIYFHPSGG